MDTGTRLAIDRTRLAYERTLMAWVRTATSMITFGFTIYKFFELEVERRPQIQGSVLGPRGFALIMIGIGVLALLISTIQNHSSMQALRAEYGGAGARSMATLVAGLFAVLGMIALVAVILRW